MSVVRYRSALLYVHAHSKAIKPANSSRNCHSVAVRRRGRYVSLEIISTLSKATGIRQVRSENSIQAASEASSIYLGV